MYVLTLFYNLAYSHNQKPHTDSEDTQLDIVGLVLVTVRNVFVQLCETLYRLEGLAADNFCLCWVELS